MGHCLRNIMRSLKTLLKISFLVTIVLLISSTYARRSSREKERNPSRLKERDPRLLSLFSVVRFANDQCSTNSRERTGTCYTARECASRSGKASGPCAMGFGVCCLFIRTTGTITENCTYVQNVGFPSSLTGTKAPTFVVQKCSNDVCSVRLDFEVFTINGPGNTAETDGGLCDTDSLSITSMSGEVFPVICGQNTGQHVYVQLGNNPGDAATLSFAFMGSAVTRTFNIKISQIPCGSMYSPDEGCFQYFTGTQGMFSTFNFLDSASTHLANQRYTACIRQEVGYCCVEYQVCNDPNSFSINTQGDDTMKGRIDVQCDGGDYIVLNGASSDCSGLSSTTTTVSKICGTVFFPAINKESSNVAVCDCQEPFNIGIIADDAPDNDEADANNNLSRGVCLLWRQLPC